MTRLLNKLAVVIAEKDPQQGEIKDLLGRIDEQKDQTVSIMSSLETAIREDGEVGTAEKVSDEADDLVEQVDRETSAARSVLASLAKKGSSASSIGADSLDGETSQKRLREKERAELEARLRKDQLEKEIEWKREELERQCNELIAVKDEVVKRRKELEDVMNHELDLPFASNEPSNEVIEQQLQNDKKGLQESRSFGNTERVKETIKPQLPVSGMAGKPNDPVTSAISTQGQLERMCIPIFSVISGNKIDFQKRNAAFSSCVDQTSLSPQFKILRLEAYLAGEAASTIKGLGYSLEAYEAAKARLFRKYGGSSRQVQSHLEELRKLKTLRDNNSKELDTFADVLERAVITLKENGRESDLNGGTLHTMILEKIPERLLAQYYRWLNDNKHQESLKTLKDWVSEEAAYQIQATEIKHGIALDNQVEVKEMERILEVSSVIAVEVKFRSVTHVLVTIRCGNLMRFGNYPATRGGKRLNNLDFVLDV